MFGMILAGILTLSNTYPRAMEIVDIDSKTELVTCVDAMGMEWTFTEPDDLEIGDVIICTMYDKGTKTILDDEIVDIRWSGYTISEFKR